MLREGAPRLLHSPAGMGVDCNALEDRLDLRERDRFDQMMFETGLARELAVAFLTPTGDGDEQCIRCRRQLA